MKICAIIPAAGKGERLGSKTPKAFFPIYRKPLIIYTLQALARCYRFDKLITAVSEDRFLYMQMLLKRYRMKNVFVVVGADTRASSVKNAFESHALESDFVLIHDAARPLVDKQIVIQTLQSAQKTGASLCVLPITSTVKQINKQGIVTATPDRNGIVLAQTPQVFKTSFLVKQYQRLGPDIKHMTDEASFFDGSKVKVSTVFGSSINIKLTRPEDLDLLKFYLKKKQGRS